jgi:glycosyltransferase involved in cell wall biosynthesis
MSADFLWPANNGGRVRSMAQLGVLASLAEVERISVFCMCEEDIDRDRRDELLREVPKVEILEPVFHPVHLFRHRRYVPRVVWLRVMRGLPYMAGKWHSPGVSAALRRELQGRTFDVVWINGLGIAYYLPLVRRLQPGARIVLDQHNVESDRFAQFAARQHGLRRLVAEAEWRAAKRYERDILRAVDAVGAISDNDARSYLEFAGVEARTVPQVVPFLRRSGPDHSRPRLCWIGSLTWNPNVRGLDWFCREVWPRVREQLPDATLEIVGPGLPKDASGSVVAPRAWRAPGITTIGFVEDLTPVTERSSVMVAPILGATGIRLKLLEAFRRGVPVVTTPDGAAGLRIDPGREAFVESDPVAFAARVVQLTQSNVERARLREAAYRFLEENHQLAQAQTAVRALLGSAPSSPDQRGAENVKGAADVRPLPFASAR